MSAVKSSIPGVGGSPPSTAPHSLMPVSAMAQKVLPNSDNPMKPLTGTGLSYVTLQPANQPLSLVHEHRQSVYQTPPYHGTQEKELEERPLPNGLEIQKLDVQQKPEEESGKNEGNRNNNLSPDNDSCEEAKRVEVEDEEEEEEEVVEAKAKVPVEFPALCTPTPKVEEKKTPVNNGSKESDSITVSPTSLQNKLLTHKDDQPLKAESQKAKVQTSKQGVEPLVSSVTVTPKPESKITGSPKASKRKSRELKDLKGGSSLSDGASKPKRNRTQTQPYQSPLPEIALLVKSLNKSPATKAPDDKLIVFYKNEFLAVRNAEGSFYVCQAMQNIYKSSRRIRIRWLSQDKNNGEIYSPDFYDFIDFDCILTNLNLNKIDKNKFQLTKIELLRTENILKRAIDVEAGVSEKPRVTEEHPDGLDLSLYKDESQLKRRRKAPTIGGKKQSRKKSKRSSSSGASDDETPSEDEIGEKKPKAGGPKDEQRKNKRISKNLIKTLAIVKSVGKGSSSRAERALNRNKAPDGKEDASDESNTNTAGTTISVADGKKASDKKGKDNVVPRTKLRGSAQQGTLSTHPSSTTPTTTTTTTSSSASNTTAGRPKRVSATILSSDESSTTRKKPRGRA